MKLRTLAAGLALASAGTAHALPPAGPYDLDVFISGASAQQLTLGALATSLFQAGTIDVFFDTASAGRDYRAYSGTVAGTGTALDGKKVIIHNRALGGSYQGVGPVARAQAISRMNVSAATCTAEANPATPQTYNCTGTVNDVPDAGVSDVEPGLFVGINLPAGQTPLSGGELASLNVQPQLAVIFGIAVTNNTGIDNLSRSQITSLLTGSYSDWSQVNPSISGEVVVQRRGPGSGTQASANAYFSGFPCTTDFIAPLDASAGPNVVENSSTGNVVNGLNAAFNAGRLAIGLVPTERSPGPNDRWHFVDIDGIDPLSGVAAGAPYTPARSLTATSGQYDYYVEQTFQSRNKAVNGVPAPSGLLATFINVFVPRSGDPAIIESEQLLGVAALPGNGYDPTAFDPGLVMKGTRQGSTCRPSQLFF